MKIRVKLNCFFAKQSHIARFFFTTYQFQYFYYPKKTKIAVWFGLSYTVVINIPEFFICKITSYFDHFVFRQLIIYTDNVKLFDIRKKSNTFNNFKQLQLKNHLNPNGIFWSGYFLKHLSVQRSAHVAVFWSSWERSAVPKQMNNHALFRNIKSNNGPTWFILIPQYLLAAFPYLHSYVSDSVYQSLPPVRQNKSTSHGDS